MCLLALNACRVVDETSRPSTRDLPCLLKTDLTPFSQSVDTLKAAPDHAPRIDESNYDTETKGHLGAELGDHKEVPINGMQALPDLKFLLKARQHEDRLQTLKPARSILLYQTNSLMKSVLVAHPNQGS